MDLRISDSENQHRVNPDIIRSNTIRPGQVQIKDLIQAILNNHMFIRHPDKIESLVRSHNRYCERSV